MFPRFPRFGGFSAPARSLVSVVGLLVALASPFQISAKAPLDREQYLNLGELLKMIQFFNDSGLEDESLEEITLKDGDRVLVLTQFNRLLRYIRQELNSFSDDLESIRFDVDDLSVNSYEYVKRIIEERRGRTREENLSQAPKPFFANSQLLHEIDARGVEELPDLR